MDVVLTPIEARVLGCLIEKQVTTPDTYPLTLNALIAACNQKSNRNPVMALTEADILNTLEVLRYEKSLAYHVSLAGSRVPKYQHNIKTIADFAPPDLAILCELLLRGPQTPGELRTRASRLHPFRTTDDVENILRELAENDPPYVVKLPREPGRRESRFMHLFCGPVEIPAPSDVSTPPESTQPVASRADRIDALEREVAELRSELAALKERFDGFAGQFE